MLTLTKFTDNNAAAGRNAYAEAEKKEEAEAEAARRIEGVDR